MPPYLPAASTVVDRRLHVLAGEADDEPEGAGFVACLAALSGPHHGRLSDRSRGAVDDLEDLLGVVLVSPDGGLTPAAEVLRPLAEAVLHSLNVLLDLADHLAHEQDTPAAADAPDLS